MKRRCPKCGAEWEIKGPIGFREECPECAAFLHTCANCAHYDGPTKGCRIPTTESVRDREETNFCEEFEFGPGTAGPPAAGGSTGPAGKPADRPLSAAEARKRFEDLFRDSKK